jgi:hypothetical protein
LEEEGFMNIVIQHMKIFDPNVGESKKFKFTSSLKQVKRVVATWAKEKTQIEKKERD